MAAGSEVAISSRTSAFGEFSDFGEAAEGVMEMLSDLHDLDAWFVARIYADEWIVTRLRGNAPFERGDALRVPAAMRRRMSRDGRTNRRRGDLAADELALVGAPLVVRDQLFGMLCGLDKPEHSSKDDSPHLLIAARILSTILRNELENEELARRVERAEAEALVDELTGLFNRRGWDRLIEREEARSARYGHGASVFMMDVDGLKAKNDAEGHMAGDALLRSVADAMRSVIRENDVAARLGGDEFALLAVESGEEEAQALRQRLEAAFSAAGVTLSIGTAHREYAGGIAAAVDHADAAMYRRKAERSHA